VRLWAISDLHLGHAENRAILDGPAPTGCAHDWLILCGDVGESLAQVEAAFARLSPWFARLVWVPGNHELWTTDEANGHLGGVAKYDALVDLARAHGVLTPEDPYPLWTDSGGESVHICPLFLLYDYSFRPPNVALKDMRAWAIEGHALCADEQHLSPAPHADKPTWSAARVAETEARLSALDPGRRTILINHFALRRDLLFIRRVPRLAPWCGTSATEDWHRRFNAAVVVTGHQHIPRTDWRDGTRFEEVSLGYPREWHRRRTTDGAVDPPPRLGDLLRRIWPPA
jgi:3',5'-cyclic AMP phosphodiesterase CpdA